MLESKYIIVEKQVVAVYCLRDDNFVHISQVFKQTDVKLFNTKIEAMCHNLLIALQEGKPLDNYKSSKYYHEYVAWLKIENPEYII